MRILFLNQNPETRENRHSFVFEFIVLLTASGLFRNNVTLSDEYDGYVLNCNANFQERGSICIIFESNFFTLQYNRECILASGIYVQEYDVYIARFHDDNIWSSIRQRWPSADAFYKHVRREKFKEIIDTRTIQDLQAFCSWVNLLSLLPPVPSSSKKSILDFLLLQGNIEKLNFCQERLTQEGISLNYYRTLLMLTNHSGFTPLMNAAQNNSQDSLNFVKTFFYNWIENFRYNNERVFLDQEIRQILAVCVGYESLHGERYTNEIRDFLTRQVSRYCLKISASSGEDSSTYYSGSGRSSPSVMFPPAIHSAASNNSNRSLSLQEALASLPRFK